MNESGLSKRPARLSGRSGVGTGTTSLLMIFTVLCFATLALLSLSTAASNRRIQQRALNGTLALAAAQGETDAALAAMDAALVELGARYAKGDVALPDEAAYYSAVAKAMLPLGFIVDGKAQVLIYTQPIDRYNNLVTRIALLPPGNDERYDIESQKSVSIGAWTPEGQGDLWGGEDSSPQDENG